MEEKKKPGKGWEVAEFKSPRVGGEGLYGGSVFEEFEKERGSGGISIAQRKRREKEAKAEEVRRKRIEYEFRTNI